MHALSLSHSLSLTLSLSLSIALSGSALPRYLSLILNYAAGKTAKLSAHLPCGFKKRFFIFPFLRWHSNTPSLSLYLFISLPGLTSVCVYWPDVSVCPLSFALSLYLSHCCLLLAVVLPLCVCLAAILAHTHTHSHAHRLATYALLAYS